jgi:hypothetical protein
MSRVIPSDARAIQSPASLHASTVVKYFSPIENSPCHVVSLSIEIKILLNYYTDNVVIDTYVYVWSL